MIDLAGIARDCVSLWESRDARVFESEVVVVMMSRLVHVDEFL